MKFSRIISLIGGEKVLSRVDNSPRGFDKTWEPDRLGILGLRCQRTESAINFYGSTASAVHDTVSRHRLGGLPAVSCRQGSPSPLHLPRLSHGRTSATPWARCSPQRPCSGPP